MALRKKILPYLIVSMELIVCVIEWEKQGCFKEVKKKNKAMGKVLGKFRKYKKNIKGAVEACMKAAKGKKLEIFGVRGKFSCATTKGNADYNVHFSSSLGRPMETSWRNTASRHRNNLHVYDK